MSAEQQSDVIMECFRHLVGRTIVSVDHKGDYIRWTFDDGSYHQWHESLANVPLEIQAKYWPEVKQKDA